MILLYYPSLNLPYYPFDGFSMIKILYNTCFLLDKIFSVSSLAAERRELISWPVRILDLTIAQFSGIA